MVSKFERCPESTPEVKPFFTEEMDWLRKQIESVVSGKKLYANLAKETPSGKGGRNIVRVGRKTVGEVPKGFLDNRMSALIREHGVEEPTKGGRIGGHHYCYWRIPGELDVAVSRRRIYRWDESRSRNVFVKTEWWVSNKAANETSFLDDLKVLFFGSF